MKFRMLTCLLTIVLVTPQMWAQANDWSKVEKLAAGMYISVVTRHRVRCDFSGATADEITCRSIFGGRELRYARSDVREVRLERGRHNDRWGTAIGAGAGIAVGAARRNPIDAAVFGLGLSVPGYAIGSASRFFARGKVVYRR